MASIRAWTVGILGLAVWCGLLSAQEQAPRKLPRGAVDVDGALAEPAWNDPAASLAVPGEDVALRAVQDGPVLVLGLSQSGVDAVLKWTVELACEAGTMRVHIAPEDLAFPLIQTSLLARDRPPALVPAPAVDPPAALPGLIVPVEPISLLRPKVVVDLAMQAPGGRRRIELAVDLAASFLAEPPPQRVDVTVTAWVVRRQPTLRGEKIVARHTVHLAVDAGEATGRYRWDRVETLMKADEAVRGTFEQARQLLRRGDPASRAAAVGQLRSIPDTSARRLLAARLAASVWSHLSQKVGNRPESVEMLRKVYQLGLRDADLVDDLVQRLADLGRFDAAIEMWGKLPEPERDLPPQTLRLARLQLGAETFAESLSTYRGLAEHAEAGRLDAGQAQAVRRQVKTMERFAETAAAESKRRQSENGNPRIQLRLVDGRRRVDLVIELFAKDAPKTVANFLKLVEAGYFTGQRLYGLEPGVMIRGGDPNTATRDAHLVGKGGPGYTLEREPSGRPALRGALAMDRERSGRSAGSRFILTVTPMPDLEVTNTVFGRVVEGLDAVGELSEAARVERVIMTTGNQE